MRKYGFPALLCAFILFIAASLALGAYRDLGVEGTAREMLSSLKTGDPDSWEKRVNESLDKGHVFINLFGALQKAMGKRYVDDPAGGYPVAKLSTGQLTFASLKNPVDQTATARNLISFGEKLDRLGIPFLTVVAPTKLSNPIAAMPTGAPDYGNSFGDKLLPLLYGRVDALDLRPAFVAADPDNSFFFKTDHHWRAEGALFACGTLMRYLNAQYGFEVNEEALDPSSYTVTIYQDLFLGSQGKRVGIYYAGTDDFTVLTPKFETSFSYTYSGLAEPRVGPFEKSLCFENRLTKDYFSANPYVYYSGGDWGRSEFVNLLNPDGPTVVLIRDSYSCALAPFLSIQLGRLITIDPRAYSGDFLEELTALSPDLVMLLFCSSSFSGVVSLEDLGKAG